MLIALAAWVWTNKTTPAIGILKFSSMWNRALAIPSIWWRQLFRIRRHGSAIYHNAWTTFICIRCCHRALAAHQEVWITHYIRINVSRGPINVFLSLNYCFNDNKSDFIKGSIAAHHALRSDPRLFNDDVDIRFSRTLNSCKLPQVRYATPERLLQRLTGERHTANTTQFSNRRCRLVLPSLPIDDWFNFVF